MCGRTVCSLAPENIQKACATRNPATGKYEPLEWKEVHNGGRGYTPSYNVCPTDITPVIVQSDNGSRIIQPMMWGIVPPWHKGSYKSHGLSTNNCRIENITTSKLYKTPYLTGNRCVVVCDGFYEWQTTKGKNKQPYFIYSPQPEGVKIEDTKTWNFKFCEENGWSGPQLMFMAALFSFWRSPEDEEYLSYSIITMESNETMSWLHHRMPAILDSEVSLTTWLDTGKIPPADALKSLAPVKELTWHSVSADVNNSRNKSTDLNKPITEKKSKSANLMMSWLQGGKKGKRSREDSSEEPDGKQQRME